MFAYSRHPLEIKEIIKLAKKEKNRIEPPQKKGKTMGGKKKKRDFDALFFPFLFLLVSYFCF
jgi:hypothetical protein